MGWTCPAASPAKLSDCPIGTGRSSSPKAGPGRLRRQHARAPATFREISCSLAWRGIPKGSGTPLKCRAVARKTTFAKSFAKSARESSRQHPAREPHGRIGNAAPQVSWHRNCSLVPHGGHVRRSVAAAAQLLSAMQGDHRARRNHDPRGPGRSVLVLRRVRSQLADRTAWPRRPANRDGSPANDTHG